MMMDSGFGSTPKTEEEDEEEEEDEDMEEVS